MNEVLYYDIVKGDFSNQDTRKKEIRANDRLSETGKRDQLAKLAAETAAYKASALTSLKSDWVKVRREYAKLEAKRLELEDKAGARWDFNRLNYLQASVKAAIDQAASMEEANAAYDAAMRSGDIHARRAWSEQAPQLVTQKFGNSGRMLGKRAARDLQKVLDTPELEEWRQSASQFSKKAVELIETTRQASQRYDNETFLGMGAGDFTQLLDGVSIDYRVDPATLNAITTVTVDQPQAQAEPA